MPLASDGRVSRTRSVAPRIACTSAESSAADTLPEMPAMRRVSRPRTPCTSAGCPVATVVQTRAGSSSPSRSVSFSIRMTAPWNAAASAGMCPCDARSRKMAGSNPSIAITRTRRPLGTTVNAARVGGLRPGRPRKEQRRAAERDEPARQAVVRHEWLNARCSSWDTRARDAQCGGHDRHRMAEEETDRHGNRERRDRPVRRRPPDVRGDRLPPEREVDEARERDERARGSRKPRAVPRERRTGLTRRQRNQQCPPRMPLRRSPARRTRPGRRRRRSRRADPATRPGTRALTPIAAAGPSSTAASTPTRRLGQRDRHGRREARAGSQHESIDARIQVAERSQPLAQLVDASIAARRRVRPG